ncbi:hypothetical protein GQ457_15G017780 [Hibiscus cannabinus]
MMMLERDTSQSRGGKPLRKKALFSREPSLKGFHQMRWLLSPCTNGKVCCTSWCSRAQPKSHQCQPGARVLCPSHKPNTVICICSGRTYSVHCTKINKFYGLQNTSDNHSKFVSGLKGKNNDFLLEDLCIPGATWDSANTSVDRDRLKPEGKLWMHFIKQSLMPTSHTATSSLNRLQLLHSILNGRSIDVGKIIVNEAYACLTRKSSLLLFPHLITALCRKKGVFESPEDLQKKAGWASP